MPGDFPQQLNQIKKFNMKSEQFVPFHSLAFDPDRTFYGPVVAFNAEKKQLHPSGYILTNMKQFSLPAMELSAL